jgi:APA family basic amino acid/polyamine antiporter
MNEQNILKRQYKFFVTICIVVGFVVGTGIFWRPGRVLYESGGDMWMGVLAWVVGGIMVAACVYMFSVMAARYEKIHGMVDYAEAIVGEKYGYLAGWFFAIMYQSAGYALIAYITATATATLAGHENVHNTAFVFFLTAFYMAVTFAVNYLAPKLPMKFNVTTTVVRVIPLILMGTVGIIISRFTGSGTEYAQSAIPTVGEGIAEPSIFGAIFATVFAYNGWQAAVAFNSEVKESKRNFPIALLVGFFFVIVVYVLYFIGVVSAGSPYALMENNQLGTRAAFANVFGRQASYVIMLFVIISGLGILNMCCMGMSRGLYSLARRGVGPIPDRMVQLDPKTNVPVCGMVTCVGVSFIWFMVLYGNRNGWFGTLGGRAFMFDLADFYNMIFFILLIPIFAGFIIRHYKDKTVHWFNRIVAPLLAMGAAGFMIYALISASWRHAAIYFGVFVVLALVGGVFYGNKKT